ncbi:protein mono-ADP-ribosyltransferase PARP12 [Procambarus clarkii]|uniref:protein mono-ADP-ribosyltransferase PARP12 n=1 Tax=Procambarus clarkii TaxID=6728 RepID=UPI001E6733EE|nr:protein mono-ADP-ribosyltransferase PARP12-like [Procambarus clarkii]XP_045581073.1 protein mono-ADP-ribosyltransferase PARP12-like [Procambarus clarkii]
MSLGHLDKAFLRPRKLVEVLAYKPNLSTTLLNLMQKHQLQPSAVRRVVFTYPRVFQLEEEVVKLRPRLLMCCSYSNTGACDLAEDCENLHYLKDVCTTNSCFRSHDWEVQPNSRILYNLFLEELNNDVLCKMVQLVIQDFAEEDGELNNDIRLGESLWTMNSNGDVRVPEICYDSVEGLCNQENIGCYRLHATRHYQWQVREEDGRWQNLQDTQVMALERAYCDPALEKALVPPPNPSTYRPPPGYLLQIMGGDTWTSHFDTMTMTNSSGEILWLRRLCTEEKDEVDVKARNYVWYFLSGDKEWIPYGAPHNNLISSVNWVDIENSYREGTKVMNFSTDKYSYSIDFATMTQTNDETGSQREVRRRPQSHLDEDEESTRASSPDYPDDETPESPVPAPPEDGETPAPSTPTSTYQEPDSLQPLPVTWEDMEYVENLRLVPLNPYTNEYRDVMALLEPGLYKRKVLGIKRIQNRQLWQKFQKRIEEMPDIYNGPEPTVRQLFHGTSKDVLPKIFRKNLDRTLQGRSYGRKTRYGHGTYFFSDVDRAFRYSVPDARYDKSYLLVAQVAVADITKGDGTIESPPLDPETGVTSDTTVNDVETPTVYVKYDKNEYYPQYVVTVT